jgi:hypothetical protein
LNSRARQLTGWPFRGRGSWCTRANPALLGSPHLIVKPIRDLGLIQSLAGLVQAQAEVQVDLALVAQANDLVDLHFGSRQRRQKQRGQQTNDRDHHQQLDQREARNAAAGAKNRNAYGSPARRNRQAPLERDGPLRLPSAGCDPNRTGHDHRARQLPKPLTAPGSGGKTGPDRWPAQSWSGNRGWFDLEPAARDLGRWARLPRRS